MFIVYFGALCLLSAIGWLTRHTERGPFGELIEWGMYLVIITLAVMAFVSLGGE